MTKGRETPGGALWLLLVIGKETATPRTPSPRGSCKNMQREAPASGKRNCDSPYGGKRSNSTKRGALDVAVAPLDLFTCSRGRHAVGKHALAPLQRSAVRILDHVYWFGGRRILVAALQRDLGRDRRARGTGGSLRFGRSIDASFRLREGQVLWAKRRD